MHWVRAGGGGAGAQEEAEYHDDTMSSHLRVTVKEGQWELMCTVAVFDRMPYPRGGSFPPGLDPAVRVERSGTPSPHPHPTPNVAVPRFVAL
jgi:hypothetical protein